MTAAIALGSGQLRPDQLDFQRLPARFCASDRGTGRFSAATIVACFVALGNALTCYLVALSPVLFPPVSRKEVCLHYPTLVVCFSLALAAVAVALVWQVRQHRATRRLLGRFLSR